MGLLPQILVFGLMFPSFKIRDIPRKGSLLVISHFHWPEFLLSDGFAPKFEFKEIRKQMILKLGVVWSRVDLHKNCLHNRQGIKPAQGPRKSVQGNKKK